MAEEKNDASGARPFQLRPSILSSGTSFGSHVKNSGPITDKAAAKGFMLRPSALSSAADQINKTDVRKRNLEDENENSIKCEEAKKAKIAEEAPECSTEGKLTEDIQKPVGIGSFGFADKQQNASQTNGNLEDTKNTVNYFQKGLNTKSEKLAFVFGTNSETTSYGFKSLKKEGDEADTTSDLTATNEDMNNVSTNKEKLLENADEYEKMHNQRKHYEEVEQFTGEEGEQHVLQVVCKLHLFDKVKKVWLEKGRGTLRLNDICQAEGIFQSRLVFRTQGTNLVQLNTMLWMDMFCEMVKDRGIRITAVDPETQEVKVYLISTSLKDTVQTFTAIDRRIQALKRNQDYTNSQKSDDTPSSNESKTARTDDEDSSTENDRLDARIHAEKADNASTSEEITT
ncbi:ran-binding protein 3-like [Hydractinia symbiolongicarpus]|uniref:ran-binding protein 3-like n=1 Tax=Hydractinia symbiolongicarpus TaxID=13093 RepID=UPI00254E6F6B|nr:ran-binding protein 3-like [Hydractinia symbiolongicarpus]